MIKNRKPKLSVCVVTYNQENYIRNCLQSIVEQATDFEFEVIVGDDCSIDGTQTIIKEFQKFYPKLIKPVFNTTNLGPFKNYLLVHGLANGEYVSHIDGDDCCLPGKFQIAVDFLQDNTLISACCHKLQVIDCNGNVYNKIWPSSAPPYINVDYLLKYHPVFGHSSLIYKQSCLNVKDIHVEEFIDFYLYFLLTMRGEIGFINKVLGCYRSGNGISSNLNRFLGHVDFVFVEAKRMGVNHQSVIYAKAYHLYRTAINQLCTYDDPKFNTCIKESIQNKVISLSQVIHFAFRRRPDMLRLIYLFFRKAKKFKILSPDAINRIKGVKY